MALNAKPGTNLGHGCCLVPPTTTTVSCGLIEEE